MSQHAGRGVGLLPKREEHLCPIGRWAKQPERIVPLIIECTEHRQRGHRFEDALQVFAVAVRRVLVDTRSMLIARATQIIADPSVNGTSATEIPWRWRSRTSSSKRRIWISPRLNFRIWTAILLGPAKIISRWIDGHRGAPARVKP